MGRIFQNKRYFNRIFRGGEGRDRGDLVFILLFVVFAFFYYHNFLDKGPLNVHMWRQTDCLSLTLNYAEGAKFFQPEMHIQLADHYTSGKTAGEFPLMYYIVGKLWQVFGQSYLLYRSFYLLILLAGTWAFYRSLKILFRDGFWAVFMALLLFTSPVYVDYGVSFLTDVPAFAFVLIALCFLVKYKQKKKLLLYFVSMAFFALAGLIKVSSLIAFVFLFLVFLLERLPVRTLGDRKLFDRPGYEFTGFFLVVLVIFSWYYYAHLYNDEHGLKYTFNDIYPIWIMKKGEIGNMLREAWNFPVLVFFSRPIVFLLLLLGGVNLFLRKKMPLLAYLANILIIAGSVIYFILWAPLMGVHDYYYTALLILFVGVFIPFLWVVREHYPALFKNKVLKVFLGVFLLYNFLYCYEVTELKTFAEKGRFPLVGDHNFIGLMKYTNTKVKKKWMRYADMKPYLKELGVGKEDKVISLPDRSFNITLYLMDRKGWTNREKYHQREDIDKLIGKGAKYLFLSDPELLKKPFLSPFLTDSVGDYKGIRIYRLTPGMDTIR